MRHPQGKPAHCHDCLEAGEISPLIEREQQLIRLLIAFTSTGLIFMVLPGTLLGVWNLFTISASQSSAPAHVNWIQAHGHAQLFGWIGAFILGIGFYSIPNLRRVAAATYWEGWLALALWTSGVALRWFTNIWQWHWQILLPMSAAFEFLAVFLFLWRSFQGHSLNKIAPKKVLEPWSILVMAGTLGLTLVVSINLFESINLALHGQTPSFPASFDLFFITLATWGFAVPFVWGFTSHWMPIFLGLQSTRAPLLILALLMAYLGIIFSAFANHIVASSLIFLSTMFAVLGLRIFARRQRKPKIAGIHQSFPAFVYLAYLWLVVSGSLLVYSAHLNSAAGILGASRHALTVGFLSTMVFCVGPRILPNFLGRQKLFSADLMFIALVLLSCGCALRVISEIVAYQGIALWAWFALPISATLELLAVVTFAINMLATIRKPPMVPVSAGKLPLI